MYWPEAGASMPRDGIYRAILWVLALTVVAGATIAILGETVFHSQAAQGQAMVRVGAAVALVAGIVYAFFRRLGIEKGRGRGAAGDPPGGSAGGPAGEP